MCFWPYTNRLSAAPRTSGPAWDLHLSQCHRDRHRLQPELAFKLPLFARLYALSGLRRWSRRNSSDHFFHSGNAEGNESQGKDCLDASIRAVVLGSIANERPSNTFICYLPISHFSFLI